MTEATKPKVELDLNSGLERGYHSQLQPAGKYENERSIYYISHIHWILSIVLPKMKRRLENSKILFTIKNAFGIFRPHSKAGCSLIHIVE